MLLLLAAVVFREGNADENRLLHSSNSNGILVAADNAATVALLLSIVPPFQSRFAVNPFNCMPLILCATLSSSVVSSLRLSSLLLALCSIFVENADIVVKLGISQVICILGARLADAQSSFASRNDDELWLFGALELCCVFAVGECADVDVTTTGSRIF